MFDAQIAVALFAAFLLGMVAGSGMEIIVRGGVASNLALDYHVHRRVLSAAHPETPERLRPRPWRERRARSPTAGFIDRAMSQSRETVRPACARGSDGARSRGAARSQ